MTDRTSKEQLTELRLALGLLGDVIGTGITDATIVELVSEAREKLENVVHQLMTSGETTDADARDAARYRWMREPQNLIVYAKSRNAWGTGGSGHIRYDTAELLDAAIDAERGAVKTPCSESSGKIPKEPQ